MADESGRNVKLRPGVVITATSEIRPDEPFVVVAVTSTFSEPLSPGQVPLPWHRDTRRSKTKLNRPTVAKCDWLIPLRAEDVVDVAGVVPQSVLLEIVKRVITS